MEQKKILWIVAALGIFLLVIFLGTLIIYSPGQTTPSVTMTTDVNNDAWINSAALAPELANKKELPPQEQTPLTAVEQNTSQDTLMQTGDVTVISQGQTTVYSQDGVTTIDLTAVSNAAEVAKASVEPSVRPVATRLPATTQEVVAEKKEIAPAPKPSTPKVVTPAKPVDQYWVQAASFVSKANADNARSALVAQKIPAEVFTHSNEDDVTFYRVRVGPYTTKSEAEYWNSLIKTVDNFSDSKSYVTNTSKPAA